MSETAVILTTRLHDAQRLVAEVGDLLDDGVGELAWHQRISLMAARGHAAALSAALDQLDLSTRGDRTS